MTETPDTLVPPDPRALVESAPGSSLPRWPWSISALVVISWFFATAPLLDLETRRPVGGASLVLPPAYVALAPLCNVMDALSLLSVAQTLALLGSLAVLYALWRVGRAGRGGARVRAARELGLAALALAVVVAFYALMLLAPRPMAALALDDPELVIVDFHSHTSASHDARAGFGVPQNRAWHRGAGFDAAFITDHKSLDGATRAASNNPARAGDGVVLLAGLEFIWEHVHVAALGATARDAAWFQRYFRNMHPPPVPEPPGPVLIQTIPDELALMPPAERGGRPGVVGIELSDGAPRGIGQSQRDRARILRIADSLDLAVIAASNNHGWGRTAVAWSVLRVPGWRVLSPAALGAAIERTVRDERRHAVRVIARRTPDAGGSAAALALTLPAVVWNLLVTLSPAERVSWLAWVWAAAGAALLVERRRHGRTRRT